jgi:glutaredoxin 3
MKIEVYSRENCGQCVMAKNLLKQRCLDFDELILDNATITVDDLKSRVAETNSSKPVAMLPQIFINGEHLGSFNDLRAFVNSNQLSCAA